MDDRFNSIRWTSLGAGTLFIFLAIACGAPRDDILARVEERGFLRAGYAQEPPYAFRQVSGFVDGEAPEALRHALSAVGVDSIRWILFDFEDLIPALEQGRVDVVAAGHFVTEERSQRVLFSRPTMCARPALAFRADASPPLGLETFADGESGVLAVVEGSVEHQAAQLMGVASPTLLPVPDVTTGLAAVRSGRADALALTAPALERALQGADGLAWHVYEAPQRVASLVGGCGALAFRRSDLPLVTAVNSGLETYVGTPVQAAVFERLGMSGGAVPAPPPSTSLEP